MTTTIPDNYKRAECHVYSWLFQKWHYNRLPGYDRRTVLTGLIGPAMVIGESSYDGL